jgi:chromosomal replication initiation ATPase DnaA
VKGDEAFALRVMGPAHDLVHPRPGWTAERVAQLVAAALGMAAEELMGGGQRRTATTARIVAAHLGRHRFSIPVAEFARLSGGRSHLSAGEFSLSTGDSQVIP